MINLWFVHKGFQCINSEDAKSKVKPKETKFEMSISDSSSLPPQPRFCTHGVALLNGKVRSLSRMHSHKKKVIQTKTGVTEFSEIAVSENPDHINP